MTLKIAVQIENLPCQETAFRPLINEIKNRKDTELSHRAHAVVGIVQGDTFETLTAATKFLEEGIPIAHLYGGDVTLGGFPDDKIRHAVSMLSDYHFPSTRNSAQNLANMGIDRSRIFTVGDPIFDLINKPRSSTAFFERYPNMYTPTQPLVLFSLHDSPNETDRGNLRNRSIVSKAVLNYQLVSPVSRLPPEEWFEAMAAASVFVTNSSSGIAEAPNFGLPCVQVGDRQKGRETARNVLWASYDAKDIEENVRIALEWKAKNKTWKNPYDIYGDTQNCKRIIDKLVEVME